MEQQRVLAAAAAGPGSMPGSRRSLSRSPLAGIACPCWFWSFGGRCCHSATTRPLAISDDEFVLTLEEEG